MTQPVPVAQNACLKATIPANPLQSTPVRQAMQDGRGVYSIPPQGLSGFFSCVK